MTRPPHFAAALAFPVTAIAMTALVLCALRHQSSAPRPAAAAVEAWAEQRVLLERELAAHPGDFRLELRLACNLFRSAEQTAQAAYPDPGDLDHDPEQRRYRRHMAACLAGSAEVAQGMARARRVTERAPTPGLRAQAWAHLAKIYCSMGDAGRQLDCLRRAAREQPWPDFRPAVASLERSEWRREWLAEKGLAASGGRP